MHCYYLVWHRLGCCHVVVESFAGEDWGPVAVGSIASAWAPVAVGAAVEAEAGKLVHRVVPIQAQVRTAAAVAAGIASSAGSLSDRSMHLRSH